MTINSMPSPCAEPTRQRYGYQARRVQRLGVAGEVREVRVVHEVDGILDEVRPESLLRAGRQLWQAWRSASTFRQPDLLLGLDAGGILPAVAVAVASDLPYRLAWKVDLDLPDKHRFTEPHARRAEVFAYGDLAGSRVLLIDDEVTTGRTLSNLVAVLRDTGVLVVGVACLIEDTTGKARSRLESLGVPLCALTQL